MFSTSRIRQVGAKFLGRAEPTYPAACFETSPPVVGPDHPRAARAGAAGLLAACVALAACAPGPGAVDVAVDPLADAAPEAAFDAEPQIAVDAPTRAAADRAGMRLLPNDTGLPGENFILAQPARGFGFGTTLEGALRAASPLPTPFEYAIASDFRPLDGYGPDLFFIERGPEAGVTCVLAVGPATSTGRSASIVMRNCVTGDAARALAPLGAL